MTHLGDEAAAGDVDALRLEAGFPDLDGGRGGALLAVTQALLFRVHDGGGRRRRGKRGNQKAATMRAAWLLLRMFDRYLWPPLGGLCFLSPEVVLASPRPRSVKPGSPSSDMFRSSTPRATGPSRLAYAPASVRKSTRNGGDEEDEQDEVRAFPSSSKPVLGRKRQLAFSSSRNACYSTQSEKKKKKIEPS